MCLHVLWGPLNPCTMSLSIKLSHKCLKGWKNRTEKKQRETMEFAGTWNAIKQKLGSHGQSLKLFFFVAISTPAYGIEANQGQTMFACSLKAHIVTVYNSILISTSERAFVYWISVIYDISQTGLPLQGSAFNSGWSKKKKKSFLKKKKKAVPCKRVSQKSKLNAL